MRLAALLILSSGLAGCDCGGYASHGPDGGLPGDGDADADADADGDSCVDMDGDGAGEGGGCPADCDDLDPELTDDCGGEENCAGGVHTTGCECDASVGIEACYTGPAGTGGVGPCRAGLRRCPAGLWGPCEDEIRPTEEECDYEDDDCDGVVDEGVLSACGDCSFECHLQTVGVGSDTGFDTDEGSNVRTEPDGSVVLDGQTVASQFLIWIANSGDGTISKVDTRTREELGRYVTDPGGAGDPSRSTVDLRGDVVSANRATSTATFIQASDCPDGDGDGLVETSTGPADVLDWGDDECVRWNLPIEGGGARGSAFDLRRELDGGVHEYVWVGAYLSGDIYEIDVEAGELTGRSVNTSPALPYGAAMAPDGVLWVVTSGTNMARVETDILEVTQYAAPAGRTFYGVTVDAEGYVWTSGQAGAQRFDPLTEVFDLVDGGCGGGIAADANGNVWTGHGFICNPRGVSRIDTETLEAHVVQTNHDTHGVAVDFDGFVWGINVTGGSADVIDPEDEFWETAWTSGINYNYTYSDMTGFQLARGARPTGTVRHVFESQCDCNTSWLSLSWDAEVGDGSSITLTGRMADTLEELPQAVEVRLAVVPGDTPPLQIGDLLGHGSQRLLEIEATLESDRGGPSPTLRSLSVISHCWCKL